MYSVLVVDDSSFFRRRVSHIIDASPYLKVADVAVNGKEAVEKALSLKPDIITMDLEMPVMNGIEAVRKIMKHHSTPILMFSAFTHEGAKATLDALEAGAVDFFPKIVENMLNNQQDVAKELQARLYTLAHKNSLTKKLTRPANQELTRQNRLFETQAPLVHSRSALNEYQILTIGASTGGPVALQKILSLLPASFPYPIVLVQHMPAAFTPAFAERLNTKCNINVKEAVDGESLRGGTAYVAPGGLQTELNKSVSKAKFRVYQGDQSIAYKPSVDITFSSIAKLYTNKVLSIILTGMGSDGMNGAKLLKEQGSTVWAQDAATSVVYGMPRAVFLAGLASESLPLHRVTERILLELNLRS